MADLNDNNDKDLYWGPGCRKTLEDFPEKVQEIVLQAFIFAQKGSKHPVAKPLQGFHGASVLEVGVPFDTNTYRAIYTTRFTDAIYVLHIFQKKSKTGIKTPKKEIDLIKQRLKQIESKKKEKNR